MKNFIFIFLSGFLCIASTNKSKKDLPEMEDNQPKTPEYFLTRETLNDTIKFPWFTKNYNLYNADAESIKAIRKARRHLKFDVYGGSWCEDTHNLLPKFYKSMEKAGVKKKNISLFGVDLNKKAVLDSTKKTKINCHFKPEFVPTFIIYYDDIEIGKIVESVKASIEKDVVFLIEQHQHKSKKAVL